MQNNAGGPGPQEKIEEVERQKEAAEKEVDGMPLPEDVKEEIKEDIEAQAKEIEEKIAQEG